MKNNSTLKAKALYFLSRREYAYLELFNKLKKYSDNDTEIQDLLQDLVKRGWLSEERFIKSYMTSKSTRYGLLKIRRNLEQKSANPQLVKQILNENTFDEVALAKQLLIKKFGTIAATEALDKARQIRFLVNRGFSYAIIQKVLKEMVV